MTQPNGNEPQLSTGDDTAASPMLGGDRAIARCEIHGNATFRDLFGQRLCPVCLTIGKQATRQNIVRRWQSGDPFWFHAGSTTPAQHIINVRKGLHPLGMNLLHPDNTPSVEACGNCKHCAAYRYHDATYYKCDLVKATGGPGTDIRKKWAACEKWEWEA